MLLEGTSLATITIVGNVNVETTLPVGTFPVAYRPTTFVPFGISSGVSAVGYNLAKALHTLGNNVRLASLIGDDANGARVRATLMEDGIDGRFVLAGAAQTPQSVVLYDQSGARSVFTDLGDVLERAYPPEHFVQALAGSDLVVLTNIAYSKPLIPLAQQHGVPIASDLQTLSRLDDAYNAPLLASAKLLFMSGELLPMPPATWAEAVLASSPAAIVVIGMGAAGAYLAVRESGVRLQMPAVATRPVVQSGGAGDALFAAFLHTYLRSHDPVKALRDAIVFASYKIGEAGSGRGFLDHEQLQRLVATLGL